MEPRAVRVLRGALREPVLGMSWVPSDALRALSAQGRDTDAARALVATAAALELDLAFVPADQPWAIDAVGLLHEAGVASVWAVAGVFGRMAEQDGWAEVLRRSATEPGALGFALSEVLHDALDDVGRGRRAGADAFCVADDLAGAAGWMLSPDFALEALMPCYRHMAAEVAGSPVVFHSDGDVRLLYAALREAGYSGVHVAATGIVGTKRSFESARSAGVVPVGGIEIRRLMEIGALAAGGFAGLLANQGPCVVCDDGGLSTAEELDAYASALRTAKRGFVSNGEG